jgi:hypothetical protein
MVELEKYLHSVLGKKQRIRPYKWHDLLDFDLQKYQSATIDLFGVDYLLIKITDSFIHVQNIINDIDRLETASSMRVVLYFDKLKSKERTLFLEASIPFIVLKSQIFIPRYYVSLKEIFPKENEPITLFSPADQMVYLYLYYQPIRWFTGAYLAKVLDYTPMTLSRVLTHLEGIGLVESQGVNTAKSYQRISLSAFYEIGKKYFINPVQSKVRLPKFHPLIQRLPQAGLKVFERFSGVIRDDTIHTYAICHTTYHQAKRPRMNRFDQSSDIVEVEIWKYCPMILSQNGMVDRVSFILSLRDYPDIVVQRMLDDLEESILWE